MAGENLAVLLQGRRIGALLRTRNGARFQFAEDVCKSSGAPLLSTALPVRAEPFDAERTKNWFSGLLPEDARLDEIRRFFGIEGDDYLAVLEEIGWECAGAVSVLPEERVYSQTTA